MGLRFTAVAEHLSIDPPVGRQSKNYLERAKMHWQELHAVVVRSLGLLSSPFLSRRSSLSGVSKSLKTSLFQNGERVSYVSRRLTDKTVQPLRSDISRMFPLRWWDRAHFCLFNRWNGDLGTVAFLGRSANLPSILS
jgi:hypothetical protein